jgi:hypothetical protein
MSSSGSSGGDGILDFKSANVAAYTGKKNPVVMWMYDSHYAYEDRCFKYEA